MAIDVTAIGLGVETSKLRQGTKDLDAFGRSANKAAGQADQSTKSMSAMTAIAGKLAVVLGAAGLGGTLLRTVDNYTKLNAQLNIAARTQNDYTKSMQDVIRISNLAQTNIDGTATLYARLANTLKDTAVTQQQFANITESVALGLRVSGASAGEAQSAMLQLSQAFASGVLRGEEFNAVSEAAFPLMSALADSMGIPIEQLRSMAMEGKITRDELVKAFSDPALIDTFKNQAKELNTVSGAYQVLKNNLTIIIGEINATTGASNALAQALLALGNSSVIRVPFETLAVLGVNIAYVFKQIGNEIGGIAAQLAALVQFDFDRVGIIRESMLADAKAARIEVDRLSEAILNPKAVKTDNALSNETAKISNNIASSNTNIKELTRLREEAAAKQNEEEVRRLNVAIWLNEEIYKQEKARIEASSELQMQADKDAYEAKQKFLDLEQKRANDNFKEAQDIYKKQVDEYERIFDRANENLSRSLTDSIIRGFEGGKKFIKNFKDAISNAFKGYVVNIGVNFIQNALSGVTGAIGKSIAGIFGMGGAGAAMAGDGVATAGLLDQAKNVFDVVTKGFDTANIAFEQGIQQFGTWVTEFGGVGESIGGAIAQYSGAIASALPFAGAALKLLQGDIKGAAFQGGGVAIGSLLGGPVGGFIGGALGSIVGGLFGGKDIPLTGDQTRGSYAKGISSVTSNVFGEGSVGAAGGLEQLTKAFSDRYGAILSLFDPNAAFTTNAIFRNRTNQKAYFGLGGGISDADKLYSNKNAGFDDFVKGVLGEGLALAIQKAAVIPTFIKELFKGITDQQEIVNMIGAVTALTKSSVQLSDRFGLTVENAAKLSKETGLVGDALSAFINKLSGVAQSVKTPAQQILEYKKALTDELGGSLPATIDAFDLVLKSFNTTTEAGRALFAEMFNLRDAFLQFNQAIAGVKKGVDDAIFSLLSPQQQALQNRARLEEEFAKFNLTVPKTTQQLIAIGEGIDYTTEAGLTLALAFPTLVQAFQAVNSEVLKLNSALNPERFRTFTDFVIASSYANAGQAIPAANMPSYDVGTSYVPQTGTALIHQGERILTRSENQDVMMNSGKVVSLLSALVAKVSVLEYDMKRTADGTQRTARELEDITGGDVAITTQAA